MNPQNPIACRLMTMRPEELHACYAKVFESIEGQIVLEDLKQRCFYYAPTNADIYTGKHFGNPYLTENNEGKRSMLLHIFTRLMPIQAKENK